MNDYGFMFDPRNAFNIGVHSFDAGNAGSSGVLGSLGFENINDLLGGLTGIGELFGGLQNYKLGKQMLDLSKKQFGFEKALANRNIANQAKTINNTYNNAAQVAAGMIGGVDSAGNFGFTDPSIVKRYTEDAKKQHVSGAAIG